MVGGAWKTYSAYKSFAAARPKAGYWDGGADGMEFYITPDQKIVDSFRIYLDVPGCENWSLTLITPVLIANNTFSFSLLGKFYANGVFDSASKAHGTMGLDHFPSSACGEITGSWNWTAVWTDASQPAGYTLQSEQDVVVEKQK